MSNKIPCGGFYLDDMLNVNDSGKLSIKGGLPYQQLVTDGDGNTRWENKMIVDSELSDTSENPVQNKVVKAALDAKLSVYVVTFSTDETGEVLTADKTYEEIASANEKMMIFGRAFLDGSTSWFPITACSYENGAIFTSISKQGSAWKPSMITLRVKPDGTVEFESTDLQTA